MSNYNLPAALLAFDSEPLKILLDETLVTCDLTFGYYKGLRKVTLTDRRDKLTIIGYRESWKDALSYVLDVWQSVQTVELIAARWLIGSWEDSQPQPEKALTELEAA